MTEEKYNLPLGASLGSHPKWNSNNIYQVEIVERSWGGNFIEPNPIYPHAIEFCRHDGKWWFRDPKSRFALIVCVPDGRLLYKVDDRSMIVSGSNVLVIPQGKSYSFETIDDTTYHKNVLYLLGINVHDILETFSFNDVRLITLPSLDYLLNQFRNIYTLLSQKNAEAMAEAAGISYAILHYLSVNITSDTGKPSLFNLLKSKFSNNFRSRLDLDMVAAEYGISAKSITRMFKEYLGVTPGTFRRQARNDTACLLLQTTGLSVKEIADKLGYSSQFHFSCAFKKENGISPREFRNLHRMNM